MYSPEREGVKQRNQTVRENIKSVPHPSLEFLLLSVYKRVDVGFQMKGVSELQSAANLRLTSNIQHLLFWALPQKL
jgi:hypothetical protein